MITWIQNTLQHHFRTVFAIILAGVIISFVFITNASSGLGHSSRRFASQPLFGYDLAKQEDATAIGRDAQLSQSLQQARVDPQTYAFSRLAALSVANDLRLSAPTKSQLETFIKTIPAFQANGTFDATRYNLITQNLGQNGGISKADLARVLNDDYRADQVEKLLGGPGYVLHSEIKDLLSNSESTWNIAVASLDYAAYSTGLKPTEEDITKYFENNAIKFTIPEQIRVSYIEFPSIAYTSGIQLNDADVRAYYDRNPARFPKPANAPAATSVLPSSPDVDFAAVKPQVEAAMKLEQASRLATKAASDFALSLFNSKIKKTDPAFPGFLAAHNATLKDAPAFARDNPPSIIGASYQLVDEAFKLDASRYFSDAIPTQAGAVVLIWQETLAPRQPVLAEVREKVVASYNEEQKRTRFFEAGKALRTQIEGRLKAGESLEKAVASVSATSPIKMEVKAHGPFTLGGTPPQGLDDTVLEPLTTLKAGGLSDLILSREGNGLLVHAIERKLPDLSDANPKFTEFKTNLGKASSQIAASSVLNEILSAEFKKHAPKDAPATN